MRLNPFLYSCKVTGYILILGAYALAAAQFVLMDDSDIPCAVLRVEWAVSPDTPESADLLPPETAERVVFDVACAKRSYPNASIDIINR